MEFLFILICLVMGFVSYRRQCRIEAQGEQIIQYIVHGVPRSDVVPFRQPPAALLLFAILAIGSSAIAQDVKAVAEGEQEMHLGDQVRVWYHNPDGSCVQCSIGMVGANGNDLNAASLLFDTAFGKAERGGSNPSRVESYCDRRGIKAWSVTGASVDDTLPWVIWSCKTGRFAAAGAGSQHFQTVWGFDPRTREFYVCNNQTPHRIDRYSEKQFRELHAASGPWVVILEKPSSPPPQVVAWWK